MKDEQRLQIVNLHKKFTALLRRCRNKIDKSKAWWQHRVEILESVGNNYNIVMDTMRDYPEFKEPLYLAPAYITGMMNNNAVLNMICNEEDFIPKMTEHLPKEYLDRLIKEELAQVAMGSFMEHLICNNIDIYNRCHGPMQIAYNKDLYDRKLEELGDISFFKIGDVINAVSKPYLIFSGDEQTVYFVYPTTTIGPNEEPTKVIRMEILKPICIGNDPVPAGIDHGIFDLFKTSELGEEATMSEHMDLLKKRYALSKRPVEELDQRLKIFMLPWLLSCSNVISDEPEEYNPRALYFLRKKKAQKAKRQPSYKFVNPMNIRTVPRKMTSEKVVDPENNEKRSVRAHHRKGHFRQVWVGKVDSPQRRTEVRWISSTIVGQGQDTENRVFYIIGGEDEK